MDPRLLMSRMTEGEKGEDDRGGKAGTTRSFTSFRMTQGGEGEDDGRGEGEASWCTKDFFVWYCWLMGRLGWGLSWFAGDLHVIWEACDG